jgi:hypothetical protein
MAASENGSVRLNDRYGHEADGLVVGVRGWWRCFIGAHQPRTRQNFSCICLTPDFLSAT